MDSWATICRLSHSDSFPFPSGAAGATAVAWLTFFFNGGHTNHGRLVENRLRHWMERDPEYGFRIALNERTNTVGNFLRN